jgi:hypothetical protein
MSRAAAIVVGVLRSALNVNSKMLLSLREA